MAAPGSRLPLPHWQNYAPLPEWLRDVVGLGDESAELVKHQVAQHLHYSETTHIMGIAEPLAWPCDFYDCPPYVRVLLRAFCSTEIVLKHERAMVKFLREINATEECEMVQEAEAREAQALALRDEMIDANGELESELLVAKGREEGLQKAVERAYQLAFEKE